jgi:hypothetical protein
MCIGLVQLVLTLPLLASQTGSPASGTLPIGQLQRVEQGVADLGPGSTSLRQPPAQLGLPTDFAGVYRIPETANSPYAGWYARVAGMGGLVAVFPRSTYRQNPDGSYTATLPPGTKFLVGGVPIGGGGGISTVPVNPLAINSRVDGAEASSQRIDSRIMPTTGSSEDLATWRPAPDRVVLRPLIVPPSDPRAFGFSMADLTSRMITEPGYRASRIAALMDAALAAQSNGPPMASHPSTSLSTAPTDGSPALP